jgi:2-methylfumaryl-CoA isomerase
MGMLAEVLTTNANRARLGNAVYGAFGRDFVTRDGKRLMIMAITPKQWAGLVKVLSIGSEVDAIETARGVSFVTDEGLRFDHREALFALVEAKVKARDYVDLDAAFTAEGCCYGAYQTMREAAEDPKLVQQNPMFGMPANPSGLTYPAPGAIATLPRFERGAPQSAPHLGQDSDAVLTRLLGLSVAEIDALKTKGLVAQP